jgi:hypothetical protein
MRENGAFVFRGGLPFCGFLFASDGRLSTLLTEITAVGTEAPLSDVFRFLITCPSPYRAFAADVDDDDNLGVIFFEFTSTLGAEASSLESESELDELESEELSLSLLTEDKVRLDLEGCWSLSLPDLMAVAPVIPSSVLIISSSTLELSSSSSSELLFELVSKKIVRD